MAVRDATTFMATNTMLVFAIDHESMSMAGATVQSRYEGL
jgi:hypothetical protein